VAAALAADAGLIVVHDEGGVSALPYYRGLHLKKVEPGQAVTRPTLEAPPPPNRRYGEGDLLPVRSTRLSPGTITPRAIHVPGLAPMFLIGDDSRSRAWLRANAEKLHSLRAIGFVVQVESEEALRSLRRVAPNLMLVPASGDDLAQRLGLKHYPVLVTATSIEP
jgi:integrating conjugative element protein (TIGR03765 family)